MRILLVDDDQKAARLLARGLQEEGYDVETAHSVDVAAAHNCYAFSLLILDWMLPGKSGVEFCRELREQGVRTPILMLTARDAINDRITGLDTGADDYLTKPFVFEELLAHVRALLRRVELAQPARSRWMTSSSTRRPVASRGPARGSISRRRNTRFSSCW
jgi:DNA-binding response OmpR family regulator